MRRPYLETSLGRPRGDVTSKGLLSYKVTGGDKGRKGGTIFGVTSFVNDPLDKNDVVLPNLRHTVNVFLWGGPASSVKRY